MKKIAITVCLMLCVSIWNSALFAETNPTVDLQHKLSEIKSISANFSQSVLNGQRVVRRTSGIFILKRPGGFRWETIQPHRQLVVSNNQTVWMYDKDLQQVTIRRVKKNIGSIPALFLNGSISALTRYYRVTAAPLGQGIVYTLVPMNKKSHYSYIQLRFEHGTLMAMRMHDSIGQTTDLRLSHVRVNIPVNTAQFSFQPPRGADVIKQS